MLPESLGSKRPKIANVLLVLALVASCGLFVHGVHRHYPINRWLFWLYAKYWVVTGLWSLAVLSFGRVTRARIFGGVLPFGESLVMSFAVGLVGFFLIMVAGGALQLYGTAWFIGVPVGMLALGGPDLYRHLLGLRRHLLFARIRSRWSTRWWVFPMLGFGVLGVVAVYLNVLIPENISYDARWYHMAIGEQFALAGGIVRFTEGWWLGTFPHLASYIYCWAFQMPGSVLFDKVELAAHLEFAIFLWTLASVPPLVRVLLRGQRSPLSWLAVFLFPGLFLYDSSLNGGADHVAAFWAIPIFLAFLRAWNELTPRRGALLGAMMAGLMNTKYASVFVVVFPALAITGRASWDVLRHRRLPSLLGILSVAGAGLLVTSPHWLKNYVLYGDPVYPLLQNHLTLSPWSPEAGFRYLWLQTQMWRPTKDLAGFRQSLEVLLTFSFVPHNWPTMHRMTPVFGSLFTMLLAALPFVGTLRIVALYASAHLGVFAWFWIQHEDRYLQALVPLMAAGVAAMLVRLWHRGIVVRVAAGALVALQIIWGSDVYFFPTHNMLGTSPLKVVADHLSTGFRENYKPKLSPYEPLPTIGKHVGRGGKILMHEQHIQLGIGVRTVQDWPGFQGGLYYVDIASPFELHDRLRGWGVTHIMWRAASGETGSVADDVVFFDFVVRKATDTTEIGGYKVSRLPLAVSSRAPFGDTVAYYGCEGDPYAPGLYHRRDLGVPRYDTRPATAYPRPFESLPAGADPTGQMERADFLVRNRSCHPALGEPWLSRFAVIGQRGTLDILVRKTATW